MRLRQRRVGSIALTRQGRSSKKALSNITCAIAEGLSHLNVSDWDQLAAGQSLFMSRPYLDAVAASGPRDLRNCFGLIYDREVPVAAIRLQLLSTRIQPPKTTDALFVTRDWAGTLAPGSALIQRSSAGSVASRKYIICGDFFASGFHGVAVHPEYRLGALWPAISAFIQRVQRLEGFVQERDYVVIKDIASTIESDARALRSCQYRRINASPAMHMEMPDRWKVYEDYLEHLNVRHRMGVYRVTRDLRRAGFVQRDIVDLEPFSHRMHELYEGVQRQEGPGTISLPATLIPSLAKTLGKDGFRCSGYFSGETLVAFVLTLRDRDAAVCYCLGWDQEKSAGVPLLPALLQTVISDGLSMGCRRIEFGRSALKAKAQVGAHPQATETWIRHEGEHVAQSLDRIVEPLSHSPLLDPALSFKI